MDMLAPSHNVPPPSHGLRVGLINNMPDAALRRTEQQIRSLLATAIGGFPIHLVMVTLPQIARTDWAARHVADTYCSVEAFQASDLDAVVITGAEPKAARLSDEVYWAALTKMFDWIEDTGLPAAYCCLAAHAAVLHRDGIERRPLAQKCSGVYPHRAVAGHNFTFDVDPLHVMPHSRWNDITEADLVAHGYAVLSRSDDVGVGAFARAGGGTDLYFQGHPEYSSTSLLREYRRDVRRYLTGERDTYPDLPFDSVHGDMPAVFAAFQQRARERRDVALFDEFPAFAAADARALPWRQPGAQIYRRWLDAVVPDLGVRAASYGALAEAAGA